jgi:hypothetical protein
MQAQPEKWAFVTLSKIRVSQLIINAEALVHSNKTIKTFYKDKNHEFQ